MKVGVLVLALFFLAPATAELGSFQLDSELPISVTGARDFQAGGTLAIEGNQGTLYGTIQVTEGTLTQVVHRATGYISPSDPELGVIWSQTVRELETDLAGQFLTIERLPDFKLLATDSTLSMQQGTQQGTTFIGSLTSSKVVEHESESDVTFSLDGYETKPFVHAIRGGQLTTHSSDGVLQAASGNWFLGNAKLISTEEYVANERVELKPGQVYDPVSRSWTGGGTHEEYVFEYFLLDLTEATVQLQYRDVIVQVFSPAIEMETTGSAAFPASTGTIIVGEETHDVRNEDLTLEGKLTFLTEGRLLRGETEGEGDITKVTYAQQSHNYDWAVALGIGAALLAIGGAIAGGAKWLGGTLGGAGVAGIAGYARVQGNEVLEHPGRANVYEVVKADPGIHFNDLLQQLPFGQSTLNYHLRVLEKNDFVTRVKDGRYARFFDRHNGGYSQGRKEAVSALRNDTTAAIAVHVLEHPGVAQKDLSSQFGIAPSTVSWHIQRLASNGLVDKERDHNHVRYYMGDAWMTLPQEELTRFGLSA